MVPWRFSSLTIAVTKSPGGSWMMMKVMTEMATSVSTIWTRRWAMNEAMAVPPDPGGPPLARRPKEGAGPAARYGAAK